jgi:hypothetical protein
MSRIRNTGNWRLIRINLSCWIRIRISIQIADPDPDPEGQKMNHKNRKSTEFSCFEVLEG